MLTVRNVLSFHRVERVAYERLGSLGVPLTSARDVICLWTWLQCLGLNIVHYVNTCRNNIVVDTFVAEAYLIIDSIGGNAPPPTNMRSLIRQTAELATEVLDLQFFWIHRELVRRGLAFVRDGVGALVFDDELNAMLSAAAAIVPPELSRVFEWPAVTDADTNTFLITIPVGISVTVEELMGYFLQRWENCVETSSLELPSAEAVPIYGSGLFVSEYYGDIVFAEGGLVKLNITGKSAWMRKYSLKEN